MKVLNFIKERLSEENELQAQILEIYKTGSQLFHNNNKDLDFVCVLSNYSKDRSKFIIEEDDVKYDIILLNVNFLNSLLNLEEVGQGERIKLYNYFYVFKEIVYGENQSSWDMFANKNEYLLEVKQIYMSGPKKAKNKWKFGKMFAHYYVILKIYENNFLGLTEEMKRDIEILYSFEDTKEINDIISWVDEQMMQV